MNPPPKKNGKRNARATHHCQINELEQGHISCSNYSTENRKHTQVKGRYGGEISKIQTETLYKIKKSHFISK